ncbi:MAG: amino acid ABC transporter permease, partial [Mycolicibacterium sp.]|nr:amino acid ABC transporter permease [Mycolicibacterium sp.]
MSGSVLFDVPGPRAVIRNRVISAVTVILIALVVWAVIARLAGKGQLTAAKWHP